MGPAIWVADPADERGIDEDPGTDDRRRDPRDRWAAHVAHGGGPVGATRWAVHGSGGGAMGRARRVVWISWGRGLPTGRLSAAGRLSTPRRLSAADELPAAGRIPAPRRIRAAGGLSTTGRIPASRYVRFASTSRCPTGAGPWELCADLCRTDTLCVSPEGTEPPAGDCRSGPVRVVGDAADWVQSQRPGDSNARERAV
jgi:hypothetical protein